MRRREDYSTNTPEDAGKYEWAHHSLDHEPEPPALAEVERDDLTADPALDGAP